MSAFRFVRFGPRLTSTCAAFLAVLVVASPAVGATTSTTRLAPRAAAVRAEASPADDARLITKLDGGFEAIEHGLALAGKLLEVPEACVPIFEDLDLVAAIKRAGRLALLRECAFTSARRYDRNGVLRQVLRNNTALAGYLLDVERERIARWYRRRPAA